MLIVGICGGSGAGKSSVSSYLQEKGYPVADCDLIYRELIQPPSACLEEIRSHFGEDCITPDGSMNREVLRQLVFADSAKRELLNSITFSYITEEVKKRIEQAEAEGHRVFVLDAPLLFESNLDKICHRILGVFSPREERLRRLSQRDGLEKDVLDQRLSCQISDSDLQNMCTDIIQNDSNLDELYRQVDKLLESWQL